MFKKTHYPETLLIHITETHRFSHDQNAWHMKNLMVTYDVFTEIKKILTR